MRITFIKDSRQKLSLTAAGGNEVITNPNIVFVTNIPAQCSESSSGTRALVTTISLCALPSKCGVGWGEWPQEMFQIQKSKLGTVPRGDNDEIQLPSNIGKTQKNRPSDHGSVKGNITQPKPKIYVTGLKDDFKRLCDQV